MTINELIKKLESIRDRGGVGGDALVEGIVLDPIMVHRNCELQPFLDGGKAMINVYTPRVLESLAPAAQRKETNNEHQW